MQYAHLIQTFFSTPWALLPEKLQEIQAFLRLKAGGGQIKSEEIQEIVAARRADGVVVQGKVAIMPIFGVLSQRVGLLERASGGISTEEIGQSLDSLMNDRQIRSIVLDIDSPGGSVYGVKELADKIRSYRADKKIVAIADSIAASAAYWIGSQASELLVTPGGQVGSIGVLVAHEDWTAWEANAGIKTSYISSAPHKAETAPEVPLSEEARAELQSKVDHYHSLFVDAVAKGRGATEARVNKDFGQGRMVTASLAVSRGMADRVSTLEQLLRRLGAGTNTGAMAAQARARAVAICETGT